MSFGVLLVDDHRLMEAGLRLLIRHSVPDATVVGQAASGARALDLVREHKPDLVLMDIHLPDGDGIDFSRQILAERPEIKIIVLSAETDLSHVSRALQAGVAGYVMKVCAPEELQRAIAAVRDGQMYLCPQASTAVLVDYKRKLTRQDTVPAAALSAREAQVLRLIADGWRTKEIAEQLQISVKTAETFRARLLKKLCCNGTAELVRYAVREGIVSDPG